MKTRRQLLNQVAAMRARVAEFEQLVRELKLAEGALHQSEQRFRSLVETTSDWVWEIDGESRYRYASPKVKDLLGYEPEEVVGRTPFHFMPPGEAERVSALVRIIAGSHMPFSRLENVNLHKEGYEVVLETSGVPIFDGKGEYAGYRGIDRDITARTRSERDKEYLILKLSNALSRVRTLTGLLPICASCKKIRNDNGYWEQIETYIRDHSDASFSHGYCPECATRLFPTQFRKE